MKITKNHLRRLVRESKKNILSEMNPDGTISDDEDDLRDDFLANVEIAIDDLIQFIDEESAQIGGGFRSPGMRRQAFMLIRQKIGERVR